MFKRIKILGVILWSLGAFAVFLIAGNIYNLKLYMKDHRKFINYLAIGAGIYILTALGIWLGVDILGFSGWTTSLVWGGILIGVKWFWYKFWGVVG